MGTIIGWLLGSWLAWNYGLWMGLTFFPFEWFWLGYAVMFLLGFMVGKGALAAITARLSLSGGGFWSSGFGRRCIGLLADGIFTVINIGLSLWIVFRVFPVYEIVERTKPGIEPFWPGLITWMTACLVGGWLGKLVRPLKIAIGRGSRPLRAMWRSMFVGIGGSTRFAGLLEEWANPWQSGSIMLGASLYDPNWKVGVRDDRHFVTIATSRSGKGRSGIVPNLLTWPGSALVIDPKGENAAITAIKRMDLLQTVYIVDPFDILKDIGVRELDINHDPYRPVRFNPLAEVDLHALNVVEQIRDITDALVASSSKTNPFFDDASKKIITGIIAHVLTYPKIMDEDRHLGTVRDYLIGANGRHLSELTNNMAAGGLAAAAAAALRTGSDGAAGDVLLTAQVHTDWLDSIAMRAVLAQSDFTLNNLKSQNITVYLILPADVLDQHARFLRIFVNMMLRAAGKGKKSEHSILFVLDEFYALGTLPLLASAAGLLAGFGVKLWPILQNLGQLRERYADTWETFLGNAGLWQVFAVNDQMTARYMSERLGHHISWRKVKDQFGKTSWEPNGATWFRTSVELARESSRGSGNQLVFREGGDAFLLRRSPYDWKFPPHEYAPNPYEPETSDPSFWKLLKTGANEDAWKHWQTLNILERLFPAQKAKRLETEASLKAWRETNYREHMAAQAAATKAAQEAAAAAEQAQATPKPAPSYEDLYAEFEEDLADVRAKMLVKFGTEGISGKGLAADIARLDELDAQRRVEEQARLAALGLKPKSEPAQQEAAPEPVHEIAPVKKRRPPRAVPKPKRTPKL